MLTEVTCNRPGMPSSRSHLWDTICFRAPSHTHRFAELSDGRTVSYTDLEKETARFANALMAAGVRPDDRVAVQVEKSIEAIMLYLACLRVGAVFLPLNAAYT